ncbi:MAG TPA: hypothetical protein VL025_16940 [Thermoanaerobaculia bacterium]|nr:hypothetical protein [Thermoanaerobaculia bacterium]
MRTTTVKILGAPVLALLSLAAPVHGAEPPAGPPPPVEIPTRYDEHRWLVTPVTKGGETLLLYTDSGGGMNMLFAPVADRLGPARKKIELEGQSFDTVAWEDLAPGSPVPPPGPAAPGDGRMFIVPYGGELRQMFPPAESGQPREAGFLGRTWFADRVWTFDYPGRRLLLRSPGDVPAHDPAHRVSLGFQTGPDGRRTTHFPRIPVKIDGETLDLLFDTGATTALTPEALAAIGDGRPAARAASFITASVFARWRERHPGWKVVEKAEQGTNESMIEVPQVEIGGYPVGPVWFTRRADRNFHEYMSRMMDQKIEGALGGSALQYLRVTVDYPGAVAVFEKP